MSNSIPEIVHFNNNYLNILYSPNLGEHVGAVVIHSPPTSDFGSSNPKPYIVYMLQLQNLDQLYVLVFSAHKFTHRDMTYTVLEAMLKLK